MKRCSHEMLNMQDTVTVLSTVRSLPCLDFAPASATVMSTALLIGQPSDVASAVAWRDAQLYTRMYSCRWFSQWIVECMSCPS